MRFPIDRKIRFGYFSAFLLLVISYLLLFSTNMQMIRQTEWINEKKESINGLEIFYSEMKDVETGYRGYLLLNDKEFIEPYNINKTKIDATLHYVSSLIYDEPDQEQRLEGLRRLVKERLDIIDDGLALFTEADHVVTDSIKRLSYQGKIVMDTIRLRVLAMQSYQRSILNTGKPELDNFITTIKIINLASLLIASLLAIYSLVTYTQENKARREADEKTILYRKQLEQRIYELDEANKELTQLRSIEKFAATGRMARTIAHEVRNPLTNIGLANDQLREAVTPNEETNMLLEMIGRNSDRINHLVSNLLNSTKFVELRLSRISINQLIDEALEMAQDRIELYNIKVEKKYTPHICDVEVDAEKIRIAFVNIIVNAIEAMEAGKGILTISTADTRGMCTVIIKDNGVGMSPESLSKLFEPFFTSKENGTGLGLTNTQNIILNHKGNIAVESKEGRGTSFTISLQFA